MVFRSDIPGVAVIIPYNKDRGFLYRAVDSVLFQTYENVQVIPIFGDRTTGANFNLGLTKATQEYVMILAEDDQLISTAVADLVAGMNGYDFVCANAFIVSPTGTMPYRSQVPRNYRVLAEYNSIHGGTVMYRRQMLVDEGGMDETMWTAEEFEMHLRLLKKGYKLGHVDAFVHNNFYTPGVSKSIVLDQERKEQRAKYINSIRARYL